MGIEDGAAVAELLARGSVEGALSAFERLRMPRCREVVDSGRANAKKWHERDAKGGTVTDDLWDYDVQAEARKMGF